MTHDQLLTAPETAFPTLRGAVAGLPSYVPGRRSAGLDIAALASNESHYEPLPSSRSAPGWPRNWKHRAGNCSQARAISSWIRADDSLRARLVDAFDRADILVRGYQGDGVRITVADSAANDRVLRILEAHAA